MIVTLSTSLMPAARGGAANFRILRFWLMCWSTACAIRYRKFHESGSLMPACAVYIANHESYFDPIAQILAMDRPYRMFSEEYYARIAFFGRLFRSMTITVNRKRFGDRVRCLQDTIEYLRAGTPVFLFPEGTVNLTGEPKFFHDGAFAVAIASQASIQPVLFLNNTDIIPGRETLLVKPGVCRIVYLDTISVEGYRMSDVPALRQKVHAVMLSALVKYRSRMCSGEFRFNADCD